MLSVTANLPPGTKTLPQKAVATIPAANTSATQVDPKTTWERLVDAVNENAAKTPHLEGGEYHFDACDKADALRGWMSSVKTLGPLASAMASGTLSAKVFEVAKQKVMAMEAQLASRINSQPAFDFLKQNEVNWLVSETLRSGVDALLTNANDLEKFDVEVWVNTVADIMLNEAINLSRLLRMDISNEESKQSTFVTCASHILRALQSRWSSCATTPTYSDQQAIIAEAQSLVTEVYEVILERFDEMAPTGVTGQFGKQSAMREAGNIVSACITGATVNTVATPGQINRLRAKAFRAADDLLDISASVSAHFDAGAKQPNTPAPSLSITAQQPKAVAPAQAPPAQAAPQSPPPFRSPFASVAPAKG